VPTPTIRADQLLFSQGFGTRRECEALLKRGALDIAGSIVRDATRAFATEALTFSVDGALWPFHDKAYLMLHKPAGTECSAKPSHWPSVYTLLPAPLRQRPVKGGENGVQAVGRLDQDTTGLLLLSDDGQFIHKMNSPKHHVQKIYRVTCSEALTDAQLSQLTTGVTLNDEPSPVRAAACVRVSEAQCLLTLTEGKYHQVKRMLAAVGAHVSGLHREQIGGLTLPLDVAPGQWCWLTRDSDAPGQMFTSLRYFDHGS
jgi:16S rRNA pseudouridine516 synthase